MLIADVFFDVGGLPNEDRAVTKKCNGWRSTPSRRTKQPQLESLSRSDMTRSGVQSRDNALNPGSSFCCCVLWSGSCFQNARSTILGALGLRLECKSFSLRAGLAKQRNLPKQDALPNAAWSYTSRPSLCYDTRPNSVTTKLVAAARCVR